jgi:hypothetical protein
MMKKVPAIAFFWILVLAVPFTALALSAVAYVTDHLIAISTALAEFGKATTSIGRPWLLELTERLPEVAGMVVGQLIILVILILARGSLRKEENKNR